MEQFENGLLLNEHNIKMFRTFFQNMLKLHGIGVIYRTPKQGSKGYTNVGELDTNYNPPVGMKIIYQDHPDQKTCKKIGWNAELQEGSVLIHVPYDTPDLQVGCLFTLPGAIDKSQGRLFKVIEMKTIALYPSEVTCELGPVLETQTPRSDVNDFTHTNFNLLRSREQDE